MKNSDTVEIIGNHPNQGNHGVLIGRASDKHMFVSLHEGITIRVPVENLKILKEGKGVIL